jgi:hypothetical protein
VIAALESYTPNVSAHNWEAVQDFARDAAALAAPTSAHSALRLLQVAGPFVVWCTAEQGLPLDAELLFAPTTIDAYCTGLTLKESTRGTYRSVLLIISKVLVPEAHQPSMVPMHRRPIQVPYTKDQVIQFRAWAKGQRTHLGRQKAMLLLAFVLGAGLTPGELGLVKREDITIDEAGVLIQVHGKLPRIVPMLRAWEKWVVAIAKSREPGDRMWGASNRGDSKNLLSSFYSSCTGEAPNSARLRATWITTHLSIGTPMKELMRAGGLVQFSNMNDYLHFVEPADGADYRALLRGARK